jgi:BNR/Asp-box repeat
MTTARSRFSVWTLVGGLIVASAALAVNLAAQGRGGAPPPKPIINEPDNPLLRGFKWRSIGPVGQGARIDDFAVDEKNPSTYFIGYAVSGVWRTMNNGTTFEPIFQTYGASSIADLTLAPSDPNTLYVATGEANNRQTTSYGDGLYKSTNALAEQPTFTKIGNFDSAQTLGRVVVHPKDPNIVWLAVGGHLYGSNPERGLYMTTDGGKTWTRTLYVDENTGATEIIIDPANPMNLWAAMYERQRTAWGFNGGGPGSGLYASTDGGKTWKKQTGNGLPNGTMGRIALDICKTNPNVLYAEIEVAPDKEKPGAAPAVTAAPAGQTNQAAGGRGGRRGGGAAAAGGGAGAAATPNNPQAGAQGGGAGGPGGGGGGRGGNTGPPDPQASGIFKSIDHGKTWQFLVQMEATNDRPMYFSQIRVDPNDANIVYKGGVNAQKSTDGGKTWFDIENGRKGHVDNHAIWIDPLNSKHLMYGDDGGLDVSYDGATTFESVRLSGVGLAYHASVSMGHPYMVCTGLQDNGSWCGPSSTRSTQGIRMWDWMSVGGGDGFQNVIDPSNENVFITESQNAGIQRYDLATGVTRSIKPVCPSCGGGRGGGGGGGGGGFGGGGRGNIIPEPAQGTVIQFNWNSPMLLSPHDSNVLYLGGHQLFISHNQGDTWTMTDELSKKIDLDKRQILGVSYAEPVCRPNAPGVACILSRHDGYVQNEFGTATEIAESFVVPGVLWVGMDDGNVQVSKDAGRTWTEVGKNVPGVNHEYYVSGLEASHFDAGTAYLALDGHRNDDLKPYIFKTTDYGATWTSVSGNLPAAGNVNAIREDPVNRNLLFAPTELGFYISLDGGKAWSRFMPNLPVGRFDEVLVHPREHDLVLSSHAFSVWIMDDITPLEAMASDMSGDAVLFKPRDAVQWKSDFTQRTEVPGNKFWEGENAPRGTAIAYWLKSAASDAKVTVTDLESGAVIHSCSADSTNGGLAAGLNRFQWAFTDDRAGGGGGGRGGGGGGGAAGGGGGGAAAAGNPTPGPSQCFAPQGGGGRGGGGGGRGGGGGGLQPGPYKVTLTVNGKEAGSQTFKVLEDIWLDKK